MRMRAICKVSKESWVAIQSRRTLARRAAQPQVTFLRLALWAPFALKNKGGVGENVVRKMICEKICLFWAHVHFW